MPIEFEEVVKKKVIQTEFFPTNTKARPLQLDGEVVPDLIRTVSCMVRRGQRGSGCKMWDVDPG